MKLLSMIRLPAALVLVLFAVAVLPAQEAFGYKQPKFDVRYELRKTGKGLDIIRTKTVDGTREPSSTYVLTGLKVEYPLYVVHGVRITGQVVSIDGKVGTSTFEIEIHAFEDPVQDPPRFRLLFFHPGRGLQSIDDLKVGADEMRRTLTALKAVGLHNKAVPYASAASAK